jgi:hypothetical protein
MLIAMRRHRPRWIAAVLAFVLAFAQVVVAAHACPVSDAPARAPISGAHAMAPISGAHAMSPMTGCDGVPASRDPAANACETHCLAASTLQNDNAAAVHVAAVPALVVRTSPAVLDGGTTFVDARTPLPTPPPLLRCTRLLI